MENIAQEYRIYQMLVLILTVGCLVFTVWQAFLHKQAWYVYFIAGVYLFSTAVMYAIFLDIGRDVEISSAATMQMSAILRFQGVATVGLLVASLSCVIRKKAWKTKN